MLSFFITYEKIILWNVFLLYWWLKQKPYNTKNNFLVQAFGLVSFHRYFESEGHYDENMSLDSCSVSHCVRTNQTSVAFTGTDELYHTVICNIRPCYNVRRPDTPIARVDKWSLEILRFSDISDCSYWQNWAIKHGRIIYLEIFEFLKTPHNIKRNTA